MRLLVEGATGAVKGDVPVPGSKYHSHRALLLASLAPGTSRITNLSDSRQISYTTKMLRDLGTDIEISGDTAAVLGGPYRPRRGAVSVGASGTTLYLSLGLTALANTAVTVNGQKYFRRRPIGALLRSLSELGIDLSAVDDRPPIVVHPGRPRGGHTRIEGTLSQWISGLLLVAPFARKRTVIEVTGRLNERSYIELTVSMMRDFGLDVTVADDWRTFEIEPGQQARPFDYTVPPDIGSAAFGLALAGIHPADVLFRGLHSDASTGIDHPEAHLLDILRDMGLPMEVDPKAGGVRVRHSGVRLRPFEVNCMAVPDMLPILAGLAAYADGTSVFHDVEHVRLKECDRVAAMCQLNNMGGLVAAEHGTLTVHGGRPLTGAALSSFNDHRVLMAFAVAASGAEGRTSLTYPHAYKTSYPKFVDDMVTLGVPMRIDERTSTAAAAPAPEVPSIVDEATRDAQRPVTEWVRHWATQQPDETAVIDVRESGRSSLTWRELSDQVDRMATFLAARGVRPGSAVACQLPNWTEFLVFSLATLRLDAVCCPLMTIFRQRETEQALRRSGATVLVIPGEFRGRNHPEEITELLDGPDRPPSLTDVIVASATPWDEPKLSDAVRWHDFTAAVEDTDPDTELLARSGPRPDSYAQLMFTSGTTGEPKGVLQRHRSLTIAAGIQRRHLGLSEQDRIFIPSPLAHQTGFLYGMWVALLLGVPQVLQDVWEPKRALSAMRDTGASFIQAATPFLSDMLREIDEGEEAPESLRIFVVTGATVPREVARRATQTLGAMVSGAWGTTETCLGTLASPGESAELMWGTDGRVLPGVELRVTRNGEVLPSGTEGELEVRTPTVFAEYFQRPLLTIEAFTPDGWYRTGDLATISASGHLTITGRLTDIINRGGEKVPVAEVEQLLHAHPSVHEVAVVSMPDERLGERACAFAVTNGDRFDLKVLRDYLADLRVTRQYWPERVEIVEALPRTTTGKIQRNVLREQAAKLVEAGV